MSNLANYPQNPLAKIFYLKKNEINTPFNIEPKKHLHSTQILHTNTNIIPAKLTFTDNALVSTEPNTDIQLLPDGKGQVLLKGDPVSSLGAVTKQYVDLKLNNLPNVHKNNLGCTVSVFIADNNTSWSGVFISSDGYILTVAQAIVNITELGVAVFKNITALVTNFNGNLYDNRIVKCTAIGYDGIGNIAVLKIDGVTQQNFVSWSKLDLVTDKSVSLFNNNSSLTPGIPCYIMGNSHGITTINNATIKAINFATNPYPLPIVKINADKFEGMIGAGILDVQGNLLTICNAMHDSSIIDGPKDENPIGGTNPDLIQFVTNKIISSETNYGRFRGQIGITTKVMTMTDYMNIQLTSDLGGLMIDQVDMGLGKQLFDTGDVLLQIDDFKCGNLGNQTSHTIAYWNKIVGTDVILQFRKKSEDYKTLHSVTYTLKNVNLNDDLPFNGLT